MGTFSGSLYVDLKGILQQFLTGYSLVTAGAEIWHVKTSILLYFAGILKQSGTHHTTWELDASVGVPPSMIKRKYLSLLDKYSAEGYQHHGLSHIFYYLVSLLGLPDHKVRWFCLSLRSGFWLSICSKEILKTSSSKTLPNRNNVQHHNYEKGSINTHHGHALAPVMCIYVSFGVVMSLCYIMCISKHQLTQPHVLIARSIKAE